MTKEAGKIALVTGANRGIGFEIARQIAQTGAHVLLSGRSFERANIAAQTLCDEKLIVTPIQIDVTDPASISHAADWIASTFGRLDILVNNAAIRIEDYGIAPSEQPMWKWRETFETNLFGVVEVTQALLSLIRESDAGRIVNVSSLLGSVGTHSDRDSYAYSEMFKSLPAYSASKSGVNSWTAHLAFELRDTPIKVNAVHPGYTKTDMNDGLGDLKIPEGARASVEMALLGSEGPSGTYVHLDRIVPW